MAWTIVWSNFSPVLNPRANIVEYINTQALNPSCSASCTTSSRNHTPQQRWNSYDYVVSSCRHHRTQSAQQTELNRLALRTHSIQKTDSFGIGSRCYAPSILSIRALEASSWSLICPDETTHTILKVRGLGFAEVVALSDREGCISLLFLPSLAQRTRHLLAIDLAIEIVQINTAFCLSCHFTEPRDTACWLGEYTQTSILYTIEKMGIHNRLYAHSVNGLFWILIMFDWRYLGFCCWNIFWIK